MEEICLERYMVCKIKLMKWCKVSRMFANEEVFSYKIWLRGQACWSCYGVHIFSKLQRQRSFLPFVDLEHDDERGVFSFWRLMCYLLLATAMCTWSTWHSGVKGVCDVSWSARDPLENGVSYSVFSLYAYIRTVLTHVVVAPLCRVLTHLSSDIVHGWPFSWIDHFLCGFNVDAVSNTSMVPGLFGGIVLWSFCSK